MSPIEWDVRTLSGSASELHGLDLGAVEGITAPAVVVMEVAQPAVVLGSTQPWSDVDESAAARLGVEVVRRRSGGGAVWVAPEEPLWVDVLVPRGHRLWSDDVGRAFVPIGRAWASALGRVGIGGLRVHDGALVRSEWSSVVCFAGVGPGEVLRGDGKVVGISQRRTRELARFQCAVVRHWDPAPLVAVLRARPTVEELMSAGVGIGSEVATADLLDHLVEELTSVSLE